MVVVDAFDIRIRGKGISRAMQNIATGLGARSNASCRYVILTTAEGAGVLGEDERLSIKLVPSMPGTVWEQIGLPFFARSVGGRLIYAHRESAPLISPPYILHIPEDPEIRWRRDPPRGMKERARARYQRLVVRRSLDRADVLLASSKTTASIVERNYGFAPGSVKPIPLGVEERFFTGVEERSENYIFHLGSSDPRDNSMLVVDAYLKLLGTIDDLPNLVIAGDLGVFRDQAMSLIPAHHSEQIALLGRVSDERLVDLYTRAMICIQPASDEGFGLQPLEAMAAGVPLIVLDTPAVTEVVAGAGVKISSASPTELAGRLHELLFDEGLRSQLRRKGRERARSYRWEHTVEMIGEVIEQQLLVL